MFEINTCIERLAVCGTSERSPRNIVKLNSQSHLTHHVPGPISISTPSNPSLTPRENLETMFLSSMSQSVTNTSLGGMVRHASKGGGAMSPQRSRRRTTSGVLTSEFHKSAAKVREQIHAILLEDQVSSVPQDMSQILFKVLAQRLNGVGTNVPTCQSSGTPTTPGGHTPQFIQLTSALPPRVQTPSQSVNNSASVNIHSVIEKWSPFATGQQLTRRTVVGSSGNLKKGPVLTHSGRPLIDPSMLPPSFQQELKELRGGATAAPPGGNHTSKSRDVSPNTSLSGQQLSSKRHGAAASSIRSRSTETAMGVASAGVAPKTKTHTRVVAEDRAYKEKVKDKAACRRYTRTPSPQKEYKTAPVPVVFGTVFDIPKPSPRDELVVASKLEEMIRKGGGGVAIQSRVPVIRATRWVPKEERTILNESAPDGEEEVGDIFNATGGTLDPCSNSIRSASPFRGFDDTSWYDNPQGKAGNLVGGSSGRFNITSVGSMGLAVSPSRDRMGSVRFNMEGADRKPKYVDPGIGTIRDRRGSLFVDHDDLARRRRSTIKPQPSLTSIMSDDDGGGGRSEKAPTRLSAFQMAYQV
eukprot:PhF_6_TR11678/c0_g1_i1/m.18910